MGWRVIVINNNGRNEGDTRVNAYRQGVEEGWTTCGWNSLGDTGLVDRNSTALSASTGASVHERLALARSVPIQKQLSALNKNGRLQLNENGLMSLSIGGIGLSTQESRRKRICSSDGRNIFSKDRVDVGQEEIIAEALPPPEPPPAPNIPAEPPPYAEGKFGVIKRIGDSNSKVDDNKGLTGNTFAIASYGSGKDDGTITSDGHNTSSVACKDLPPSEVRPPPNITYEPILIDIPYDDIQNLHLYSSDTARIGTHIRQLSRNGVLSTQQLSRMGNRKWSIGLNISYPNVLRTGLAPWVSRGTNHCKQVQLNHKLPSSASLKCHNNNGNFNINNKNNHINSKVRIVRGWKVYGRYNQHVVERLILWCPRVMQGEKVETLKISGVGRLPGTNQQIRYLYREIENSHRTAKDRWRDPHRALRSDEQGLSTTTQFFGYRWQQDPRVSSITTQFIENGWLQKLYHCKLNFLLTITATLLISTMMKDTTNPTAEDTKMAEASKVSTANSNKRKELSGDDDMSAEDEDEQAEDVTPPSQLIPPTPTAPRASKSKVAFAEDPNMPELTQPTITSLFHAVGRGATGPAVSSARQPKLGKIKTSYASKAKSPPKPLIHITYLDVSVDVYKGEASGVGGILTTTGDRFNKALFNMKKLHPNAVILPRPGMGGEQQSDFNWIANKPWDNGKQIYICVVNPEEDFINPITKAYRRFHFTLQLLTSEPYGSQDSNIRSLEASIHAYSITVKEHPSHMSAEEFVLANLHRDWDPKYVASAVNKSIEKGVLEHLIQRHGSDEAGQAEFDKIKPFLQCVVRLKYPFNGRYVKYEKGVQLGYVSGDKLAWVMEIESKAVEIIGAAAKVIRTFLQYYLSRKCYIFRIPDEKDDGDALELYRSRLDIGTVYSACTSTSLIGEALAIDSVFNLKTGHVDGEAEVETGSIKLTLRKILMETKVPGTDKKVFIGAQLNHGRVLVFFPNKSTHETEVLKICKVGPWCMWILSSRYGVIPSEIERVMRKMFSSTTCTLALTSSQMTSDGRCIIKASAMKATEAEDSDDDMDGEDWLDMSLLHPRKEGEIDRAAVENGVVYDHDNKIDDDLMSMNTKMFGEAHQGDISDDDFATMEEDDLENGPSGIDALRQKARQANVTPGVPNKASTQALPGKTEQEGETG